MGSEGEPSAKRGAPKGRKNTIHFVNAQPASESERLNNKKLVRAHVGQWISNQTKDRIAASAAGLTSVVDPPPLALSDEKPHLEAQAIVEVDPDEPCLPSDSPSSTLASDSPPSSHDSPVSSISSASRHVVPIFTKAPRPQSEPPSLAIVPSQATAPSPTNDIFYQQQCDDEDEGLYADSSESDALSPPSFGDYIEVVGAGSLDPFRAYPAHIDPELIQLSDDYCISCLWPGLTPGPSGTNMQSWFPLGVSDPVLFTAFLFGSLSHMRVQALKGWIPRHSFRPRQQRLLEHVEMETVRLVSREMSNLSRAICDAMIWSVVCMAHNKAEDDVTGLPDIPFTAPMRRLQWLDVYGCLRPNPIHIGGLIQMVNLRGGIEKIELPGLASVISFSDVVTSSTFLLHPVFPWMPLEPSRKNMTMQELLRYADTDVDRYYAQHQHLGLPRSIAEVLCAMNTYTNLVEQAQMGGYDLCLLADQRSAVHYSLLCLPSATLNQTDSTNNQPPHLQPQHIIYEAIRLACLIYSVGIVLPIPPQSSPIMKLAKFLRDVLSIPDFPSLWTNPQAQVALLWVLTLGGIAATHTPHHSWYIDRLRRVVQHHNITSYNHLTRYLAMLAWYPIACDKPGLELWFAIERVYQG
ncbi:hypothetical protein BJY01DRAFT_7823 [Aspergillus pseudoustus]|uniref:Fungal-specific transcription factor domain-containing protein n=1 Tax=Aspergillus pseudoustus TaxID=1810923 RepID=A0ABR4JNU2_9EURO